MNSSFELKMKTYKNLVDDELNNIYESGPVLLREPINYIVKGGKRLRPSLCLLVCNAFGKDLKKALIPAVSIELLHMFSLVHDDIMDDDSLRHNKLTIHKKWNNSVAILVGDAILALAFKRLNNADNSIKELFNSALIAVCEGQALDIEYENIENISNDQYFDMISLKTGHMLGLSAQLGGLLSELEYDNQLKLKKYGCLIGKAFQIQDDILEVLSDTNIMGKSLESDFFLGKKTLLMIDSKKRFPNRIKEIFATYKKDRSLAFDLYKELLVNEGTIDKCKTFVENTFIEANDTINGLVPNNTLYNFTKMIADRKY